MAILGNELVTQVVSDVECSNCGDSSSAFCEQCCSHYCKHCSLLMHKYPKRKGHTIISTCLHSTSEGIALYFYAIHVHVDNNYFMLLESYSPLPCQTVIISGLAAQKFGVASLHTWQRTIIEAAINKMDCLVIEPTGAGKSACYIMPPLFNDKTAIVIAPTISLTLNQVAKLTEKQSSATLLGSAQPNDVFSDIRNGEYRLVYTTPETFYDKLKNEPRQIFQVVHLTCIIIILYCMIDQFCF